MIADRTVDAAPLGLKHKHKYYFLLYAVLPGLLFGPDLLPE